MKPGRVSQTALKVALTMITLSEKEGWQDRLPGGLVELSERLILAAGMRGYGPALMRLSKQQWVVRLYDGVEAIAILPGTFEGVAHRKIFMNEQVLAAIEAGATQVLVLGAGFDTLCLRLASQFPHVQFFEVDQPATSAAKAKGVAQEGQPENLTLVAADLGATPLSRVMGEHEHWDAHARAVLVAEGLLMYLERDDVLSLFREAAACTGPGSRLAFSHLVELEGASRFAFAGLRLLGEPWRSAVASEDLPEYIAGTGWSVTVRREPHGRRDLEGFAVAEREPRPKPP